MRERPIIPGRGTVLGRAVTECKPIQVNDVEVDPEYTLREGQRLGGFRTVLGIPLLRESVPIGVIVLTRNAVRPFTDKQIELATTFADQAAIAIENVRLFEAEQQRTQELARSIEDLQTTQDRLVQTQKLASLGQLTAGTTRNLGDRVEITIRDNGAGIPPEVREKMFNPFFTTKPAGEGTGLGLSISHDIIVKQHAGSIEVETEPGEFTEFKIVLPRVAASLVQSGGRA
jgi:C4-dicarboxylate-specific signal transduction histidine kinase